MRQYYHKNTYLINQVENGFTVEITGTKENQEDGILAGYYVFETVAGLTAFLTKRFSVSPPTESLSYTHAEYVCKKCGNAVIKRLSDTPYSPSPSMVCVLCNETMEARYGVFNEDMIRRKCPRCKTVSGVKVAFECPTCDAVIGEGKEIL